MGRDTCTITNSCTCHKALSHGKCHYDARVNACLCANPSALVAHLHGRGQDNQYCRVERGCEGPFLRVYPFRFFFLNTWSFAPRWWSCTMAETRAVVLGTNGVPMAVHASAPTRRTFSRLITVPTLTGSFAVTTKSLSVTFAQDRDRGSVQVMSE